MFFELREYRIKGGQRERWVKLMEEKIIPFQMSKGMVAVASFVATEEPDLYVWIRRFESEEERDRLYKEVYESDYWKRCYKARVERDARSGENKGHPARSNPQIGHPLKQNRF